jgi:hypothetical protein
MTIRHRLKRRTVLDAHQHASSLLPFGAGRVEAIFIAKLYK